MVYKISLPFQLILILLFVGFFGHMLPEITIKYIYSISVIFKECLSFLLPFIVFFFITSGILSFKKNAPLVLTILLSCVLISNAMVAFFSYFIGKSLLPLLAVKINSNMAIVTQSMQPLFTLGVPPLFSSFQAMLAAIFCGVTLSFYKHYTIESSINHIKSVLELIINSIFIPILPFYVLGFLLEINHQGVFMQLFHNYGRTFALIIILQLMVIFIIYFIAAQGNLKYTFHYLNNAMPSYITAFGTMSSTATIPVTITCAEKNTHNEALSIMATPILANIHLLGDAISTPMLALVSLFIFNGMMPDVMTYSTFVIFFCINMLAAAGVPGGGIFVMHPILINILGFNDVMISIITTLYILQDGLGTAGNVMGDGALMIIINKILKRFKIN